MLGGVDSAGLDDLGDLSLFGEASKLVLREDHRAVELDIKNPAVAPLKRDLSVDDFSDLSRQPVGLRPIVSGHAIGDDDFHALLQQQLTLQDGIEDTAIVRGDRRLECCGSREDLVDVEPKVVHFASVEGCL